MKQIAWVVMAIAFQSGGIAIYTGHGFRAASLMLIGVLASCVYDILLKEGK